MPAIIDHDAVKMNILAAFQSCIEERTITQIPLRMVAERAGLAAGMASNIVPCVGLVVFAILVAKLPEE